MIKLQHKEAFYRVILIFLMRFQAAKTELSGNVAGMLVVNLCVNVDIFSPAQFLKARKYFTEVFKAFLKN